MFHRDRAGGLHLTESGTRQNSTRTINHRHLRRHPVAPLRPAAAAGSDLAHGTALVGTSGYAERHASALVGPRPASFTRDRLTCAIRLIMVIPQAIVLFFVDIAAFFAVIAAWFVALFSGRLAGGLREFIAGTLRWGVRVQGYFFFLTDTYPPYSLGDDETYPIRLAIPPPVELNRAAVLFRLFIAIPGWIVANVLGSRTRGRLGRELVHGARDRAAASPLFEATRAVLRYQARFFGYFSMLTPEYPWGAMGDSSSLPAGADPYEAWSINLSSGGRTAMIVVIVLGVISELINNRGRL